MEPMNISVAANGRDWRSSAPRLAGAFQVSHSRFFATFLIHNPELETELTYTKQKVDAVSNRQENTFLKITRHLNFHSFPIREFLGGRTATWPMSNRNKY